VKAAVDGARQLGLQVYEIGRQSRAASESTTELAWDASGRARLLPPTTPEAGNFWRFTRPGRRGRATFLSETNPGPEAADARRVTLSALCCVNESCPTFIHAEPPARKGDPRFPVAFTLDANKRLCVSVRDQSTGATLFDAHPVVRLR